MESFLQAIFTALTGPIGIALVGIFLVKGIMQSIQEHRLLPAEIAIVGGGAFYSVAWIVSTWLQAGGGA